MDCCLTFIDSSVRQLRTCLRVLTVVRGTRRFHDGSDAHLSVFGDVQGTVWYCRCFSWTVQPGGAPTLRMELFRRLQRLKKYVFRLGSEPQAGDGAGRTDDSQSMRHVTARAGGSTRFGAQLMSQVCGDRRLATHFWQHPVTWVGFARHFCLQVVLTIFPSKHTEIRYPKRRLDFTSNLVL